MERRTKRPGAGEGTWSRRALRPLALPGRSAAAILGPVAAGSPSRLSPLGLLGRLRLAESVGKEGVRGGRPELSRRDEGGELGEPLRVEMAAGGPGLPPRPPVRSKGQPGLAGLLTRTPGIGQGERGDGGVGDDGGAPLPDAGQRRPRSSFVIPPLGAKASAGDRRGAVPWFSGL